MSTDANAAADGFPADDLPGDASTADVDGRRARPHRCGAALVLAATTVVGLAVFCWPLVGSVLPADGAPSTPWLMLVLLPVLLLAVLLHLGQDGFDARTLAMLGVLAAVNAALRLVGAGTGGIELVFFLLVLAGYAFGPVFGFLLGTLSLFASALLTAGVGPWLPFQMLACGWVGLGAGLLGLALTGRVTPRGRVELAALAVYAALAAYAFGAVMNLWFWPFTLGGGTTISYVPGGGLIENLRRFAVFTATTSTFTWDTVRAVTNVVAVVLLGRPVLGTFARARRRAAFG